MHKMKTTGDALSRLRVLMSGSSLTEPLVAYIIPSDDAHQSEYLAARDRRRHFITGFTGSAGTAVVTQSEALLWTDGRYYQQASQQLDTNWTLMKDGLPETPTMVQWLQKNCKSGDRIGVDANLMSTRTWNSLANAFENEGCIMTAVKKNLIDEVWDDQPAQPNNSVFPLDVEFTGKLVEQKLIEVREKMSEQEAKVMVVTALDEIAYLLNLRGSDINANPVFFSYVIVTDKEVYFFIDPSRVTNEIRSHFSANKVEIIFKNYDEVFTVFEELAKESDGKVWVSLGSSQALTELVPKQKRIQDITPIAVMKAIKNDVEVDGMRNSHIRDGVALVQYFAWLENEILNKRTVTEISGADKLEEFRSKQRHFKGVSFGTINGSGPNGSIIHYGATNETNREITDREMYLCDSGGQYLDGTTDVTRTWHFGAPSDYERECFTRVFKGQWQMGSLVFPNKVKGRALDSLARKFLWDYGLDYGHGTGHGIGSFLNVHEGPMGIGTRDYPDDPGLQVNMFLSNEPGYYEEGQFGIRIEDIVQIVKANVPKDFAGRGALTFYTVTLCPISTKLIKVEMLTEAERQGLNAYHKRVYDTLKPLIDPTDELTLNWLQKETNPI
ncbi:CLUMA_CG013850, isoform A [Clunio marinus]|uniref:CLUMA_CG013850, isoform A n=1 Tax=Clunio marinus TaxID=568069 RepID=A0A1J1INB7_9DIPT|nr:CLUMA_CG013850, isoform A [Clunio marinus]